jgi:hypothetical protein
MIRTQVQLTESQMRDLKRIARREGVSMAEVVRRSVDSYIRTCDGPSREELVRRARSVVGRFRDREGKTDVSVNHDEYLAEAYSKQ